MRRRRLRLPLLRCVDRSQPRQLLDLASQQDDYRSVVDWARRDEGIDPDRIALWGSSFSGGHVLAVAAEDPRIAAVIAQAPFTDGLAVARRVPLRALLRDGVVGMRDLVASRRGAPPVYLAAVGPPGTLAVLTEPDAQPGFAAIVGPNTLWRNEVAARIMMNALGYRPFRYASRLLMPVLFCVCDADTTTPPGPSLRAARDAPKGELRRYPYGHFDIYNDPRVKADQVEFLRRVLGN